MSGVLVRSRLLGEPSPSTEPAVVALASCLMDSSSAALLRRVAGWLLLSCTLFGLVLMHTLGHELMTHHDHERSIVADSRNAAATPTAGSWLSLPCQEDGCHPLRVSNGSLPRHGNVWDICLAIVAGSLIVSLLSARGRGIIVANVVQAANMVRSRLPRPPPRPAHGLTVTAVSVLRT